ncbi:MAG: RDD family protein [Opitutaceae bacterium]
MPESTPANSVKPDKSTGRVVNPEVLHLDPRILDMPLAAPWQRAGAMAADLLVIGALSLLAGPVLGLLTGVTMASIGSRRVSKARFWQAFRWVLILLGAGVVILSSFLLVGRPIIRTAAFNLGSVAAGPSIETVYISPSAGTVELRRAAGTLQSQVDQLVEENERLRQSARGNSLVNTATDFSSTLGLTFGWAGVYFTLCTVWLKGLTPGKWLFRTRVVKLDGRPLTPMDAFVRYGGYAAGLATGSIGFLRLLWDPNLQAIEDKIAGTVVVRSGRKERSGPQKTFDGPPAENEK